MAITAAEFIQKLENGEIDLDTWEKIVNANDLVTPTRLNGNVNTWFGLQAALSAATGRVFFTKAQMDAAPGTMQWQAARVTEDTTTANIGLYIWSGSAWVKTKDPLTNFDSLTINRDKDYPMQPSARGGTAPQDIHPTWKAALLGLRIEGVNPDLAYRLAYYGNGVLVSGVANYGVTVYSMPTSDLTNQTAVSIYTSSPSFKFDRARGGIQSRSAVIADGIRLTLVVDVGLLSADGTPVISVGTTHNGYNSIISPDCYFYKGEISQNSLSINENKDYPFVAVARGGTAATNINPQFKSAVVGVSVENAREGYFYRVGYYGNGVDVSGVKYYGFSIYRIPLAQIANPYQETISDYQTSFQFIPDRVKGGIQTAEFSCKSDPQTRIRISMNVNLLPVDGTAIVSAASTHSGYNSIIDPSCYTVGDFSKWIEGDCLVHWDATTAKLIVAYKSGGKWYNVRFQRKSVNQTFTILGFGYDDAYLPVLNNILPAQSVDLSSRTEATSDWIAPMTFNLITGGDEGTTQIYTGGSHGTDNAVGDPTSEMKLLDIYIDGTRLDQTRNVHKTCRFVEIVTQQDVQAWNTIITKRVAAEEYIRFLVSPKGVFVHKKMKALFDLSFMADNGCQMYMAGMTPQTSNTYLLWGASQSSRSAMTETAVSSGPKSAYSDVYGISIRHPAAGEFSGWVDPFYGVGDRAILAATEDLYRFDGTGKFYPRLFSIDSPYSLSAGDSYEWRGGYYWGMPTNTTNFDTIQQVQDGIVCVKPDGKYILV